MNIYGYSRWERFDSHDVGLIQIKTDNTYMAIFSYYFYFVIHSRKRWSRLYILLIVVIKGKTIFVTTKHTSLGRRLLSKHSGLGRRLLFFILVENMGFSRSFQNIYKQLHWTISNVIIKLIRTMTLNTYELTSLNADLHFQNNLYSQVTSRQVRWPGFAKSEQSRLVFYFDYLL